MKPNRLLEIVATPVGRTVTALVGLGLVVALLHHTGIEKVMAALGRAAPIFPIIIILEVFILFCSMCALRLLYLEDRDKLPIKALIRAGLVGYTLMGLVPAGRTAAESARAALLARYSSGARAMVAATQLQGIALIANCAISFFCLLAMFYVLGFSLPTFFVLANFVITGIVGIGLLFAGRKAGIGTWLGKRFKSANKVGTEFDQMFSATDLTLVPFGPFAWEFLGRITQVVQNGFMVVAVGGALGLIPALCSESLHLVGAAAGDLIPAQLGATEVNYQLSAHALSLAPADAMSIALIAHLAQIFLVVVGLIVPLVWRPE
jgi:hypothetical protein